MFVKENLDRKQKRSIKTAQVTDTKAKLHSLLLLLNSRSLISTNGYVLFLRYGVNKTHHISRTFRRTLLACIKTVFCNLVIFVFLLMVFNLLSRALAGVPRAPTTNGTTATFMFHTFFSSLATSKYFSISSTFLSSTLVSCSIAKSIIWHSLCSLSKWQSCQAFLQL